MVAKIMKQNRIQAKTKRKWKATSATIRDLSKVAPNLLEQDFSVAKPNLVWVLACIFL